MKKLFFALASVAMLFATSCNKNQNAPEDITLGEDEFLATIDNGANPQNAPVVKDGMSTKTTIDGNRYVIWETDDEISINGSIYTTTSNPGSTVVFSGGKATGSTFHAFFPATIAGTDNAGTLPATQTIVAGKVSNLPMYAYSTTNQLEFHNICAALKIVIPSFLNGATSIEVSCSDKAMNGAFTVTDNAAVMTATTPTDAEKKVTIAKESGTFATNDTVYIAVPANTYSNFKIEFFSNTTTPIWTKTLTSQTLNVNKVYNVNITEMPDANLLPGLFSVSASQQVQFTKGNLNGTSPDYYFESSQLVQGGTYTWTTAWQSPVTVGGRAYRVLSKDELNYLLNTRAMTGTTQTRHKFCTCNGVCILALFPDNYTGAVQDNYTMVQWQAAETAGAVGCFIPYTFYENDWMWTAGGYYWTSQQSGQSPYALWLKTNADKENVVVDLTPVSTSSVCMIRLVKFN